MARGSFSSTIACQDGWLRKQWVLRIIFHSVPILPSNHIWFFWMTAFTSTHFFICLNNFVKFDLYYGHWHLMWPKVAWGHWTGTPIYQHLQMKGWTGRLSPIMQSLICGAVPQFLTFCQCFTRPCIISTAKVVLVWHLRYSNHLVYKVYKVAAHGIVDAFLDIHAFACNKALLRKKP